MKALLTNLVKAEISLRDGLTRTHKNFYARLRDERGDVPGWVLVVLMTTGLVTAIWTIAAPRQGDSDALSLNRHEFPAP